MCTQIIETYLLSLFSHFATFTIDLSSAEASKSMPELNLTGRISGKRDLEIAFFDVKNFLKVHTEGAKSSIILIQGIGCLYHNKRKTMAVNDVIFGFSFVPSLWFSSDQFFETM